MPTRRDFLKTAGLGTAAAAAGAAIEPGTATAAPPNLKIDGAAKTVTICPFCGVGCGQVSYNRGDELLHVEGDLDHPISEGTLCSKGAALSQVTNNPHRLQRVLYRAPGSSKFEPRSWEWAFARIAEQHRNLMVDLHRLADRLDRVGALTVERVHGDDERHAARLEVVDRGEAVAEAPGVGQDDRTDRTA